MYVPTKDNPADYLSRGCTSKQLKSSNWLHGPSWLLTREFPEQTNTNIVVNELTVEINPIHPIQPLIDLTKFNSYIRVMRIMITVSEFCQSPANPFEKLVRQEQLLHCTSIHAHLTNTRINVNVEVKTTIKQLNLYLKNDTIRAKGRIITSELPLDTTTPLFLPNKSHLVDLLIYHIHSSHHHVGLSQTLSLYRQRCWTPKIRSRIKSLLLRCVICQRTKKRTLPRPLPPPLPTERVRWVPPFTNVGVDHTGSFTIRDAQGRKAKAYICLFVCATTRAMHLEVVDNLTTTSFIMYLRRLAASKGMPSIILSDNHKTFIAGETFLLNMQQDPSVQEYLAAKHIRWKHQTPRSPWMGGHFERLVRTIKASLATAISRKLLTLEDCTTVVKEAENIVNSRPLTYQSDESRDIPLTPSQLAWGRDLTLMPPLLQPGDPLDEDYDAKATRAQYVLLSNALERFRKRWHTEYLLSLREKHYNKCAENPTHHLSVGKLVMIKHDNVHCIEWPLGVITAIYPDEKGVIRTAEVEECGRRSLRPVSYLVPLELDCHREDDELRQCLGENQGNEEEDDDDNDDDAVTMDVDSTSEAEDQGSPIVSADAQERSFPLDASSSASTLLHRTSGSSRESGLATGTTTECNTYAASPTTTSPSLPPYNLVHTQTSEGEERDAGRGEASTSQRQPRRAALKQRELLKQLLQEDKL